MPNDTVLSGRFTKVRIRSSIHFAPCGRLAYKSHVHSLRTLPAGSRGITDICYCGFKWEVLRGIGKLFAEAFDSAFLEDG